jgi:hypothetical protein
MSIFGWIGSVLALLVVVMWVAARFPKQIERWVRGWEAPSESNIKKRSKEMLAQMDRNVAERKAKKGG